MRSGCELLIDRLLTKKSVTKVSFRVFDNYWKTSRSIIEHNVSSDMSILAFLSTYSAKSLLSVLKLISIPWNFSKNKHCLVIISILKVFSYQVFFAVTWFKLIIISLSATTIISLSAATTTTNICVNNQLTSTGVAKHYVCSS